MRLCVCVRERGLFQWKCSLHGVVEHHVLFGQLQQHRIVEELADTYILAQSLLRQKVLT